MRETLWKGWKALGPYAKGVVGALLVLMVWGIFWHLWELYWAFRSVLGFLNEWGPAIRQLKKPG